MPLWSHSRIATYEQCPRKYKYQYIDKLPKKQGIHAFLGQRVHAVLENLYKNLQRDNLLSLEDLLRDFKDSWDSQRDPDLVIPEGRDEEAFKSIGRRCIANYYARYHPFDQDKTLAIEERIMVNLEDGSTALQLQGYIDRLAKRPDGTVVVHDYKTAGKFPGQSDADTDRQLALYQLGVQQRWPHFENVELLWHYVAVDEELKSCRTAEQLKQTKEDVVKVIRQIELDETFEPHKSALCSYCDYQSRCPLWKHLFHIEGAETLEQPQVSLSKLVDEYGEQKRQKKEAEAKMKELEEDLAARMQDNSSEAFYGKLYRITLTRTHGISVPPKGDPQRDEIEKVLRDAGKWNDVAALDIHSLKKLITEKALSQDLLDRLESLVEREQGIRFSLATRKKDEVESVE